MPTSSSHGRGAAREGREEHDAELMKLSRRAVTSARPARVGALVLHTLAQGLGLAAAPKEVRWNGALLEEEERSRARAQPVRTRSLVRRPRTAIYMHGETN